MVPLVGKTLQDLELQIAQMMMTLASLDLILMSKAKQRLREKSFVQYESKKSKTPVFVPSVLSH